MLNHAEYSAPNGQRELDNIDQEPICPEGSRSRYGIQLFDDVRITRIIEQRGFGRRAWEPEVAALQNGPQHLPTVARSAM